MMLNFVTRVAVSIWDAQHDQIIRETAPFKSVVYIEDRNCNSEEFESYHLSMGEMLDSLEDEMNGFTMYERGENNRWIEIRQNTGGGGFFA